MATHTTETGRTLTGTYLGAIVDEVESAEYDVEALKTRRRGRPAMDSGQGAEGTPVAAAAVGVEFLEETPPNTWTNYLQIPRKTISRFLI